MPSPTMAEGSSSSSSSSLGDPGASGVFGSCDATTAANRRSSTGTSRRRRPRMGRTAVAAVVSSTVSSKDNSVDCDRTAPRKSGAFARAAGDLRARSAGRGAVRSKSDKEPCSAGEGGSARSGSDASDIGSSEKEANKGEEGASFAGPRLLRRLRRAGLDWISRAGIEDRDQRRFFDGGVCGRGVGGTGAGASGAFRWRIRLPNTVLGVSRATMSWYSRRI
ncbi:hypothetical protein TCAL_16835 [Tigriopus californicus]|uniref:Uncharacterized protein n=1 Tax=Tigriopus californicus TaxID=6832 RepID=A0A553PC67_TIGCA|nr:hypothetical protein TCAL_16835 [Tigriopus californicus]